MRPNEADTDFESNSCVLSAWSTAMPNCVSSACSTVLIAVGASAFAGALISKRRKLVALRGRVRIAAALDDGVLAQVAVDASRARR